MVKYLYYKWQSMDSWNIIPALIENENTIMRNKFGKYLFTSTKIIID